MNLADYVIQVKKNYGSKSAISNAIAKSLYKEDKNILNKLKAHSPVDTGDFRSNWRVNRTRFVDGGSLAGLSMTNNTPRYGQFAAFGARPQKAPWYYPHRDRKTGRFKKGTGKLKMTTGKEEGRVWAGGLKPGHDKTVGGPLQQALINTGLLDKLTIEITNSFVKGFI